MDGCWMDGRIDGWMDGRIDGGIAGGIDKWTDGGNSKKAAQMLMNNVGNHFKES